MDKKKDNPLSKWTREKARAEAQRADHVMANSFPFTNDCPDPKCYCKQEFDLSKAETRPAVKSPRAIVSVAFSKEEFEQVSDAADWARLSLSKFIRGAALREAHFINGPPNPNETANPDAIVTTNG